MKPTMAVPGRWDSLHLFRGMMHLSLSLLFISFLVSGAMKNYIAPQMMPFAVAGALLFLFLGISQFMRSSKGVSATGECDCQIHHHDNTKSLDKAIVSVLFILPVVLGVLFPKQILDSSIASKRGVQVQGQTADQAMMRYAKRLSTQSAITLTDANYAQSLNAIMSFPNLFEGKRIELTGFVYRESGFPRDEWVLARFYIVCCIADATVIGIYVKSAPNHDYPSDAWMRVVGEIQVRTQDGYKVPYILLDSAEPQKAPKYPYIY